MVLLSEFVELVGDRLLFVCLLFRVLYCLLIGWDWVYIGMVCCGNSSVVYAISKQLRTASERASGLEGKQAANYPSRDARAEHGGPGFGAKPKPRGQPKARAQPIRQPNKVKLGGPDCTLCTGLCCGVARALVEEAFRLGVTTLSPKVRKSYFLLLGC